MRPPETDYVDPSTVEFTEQRVVDIWRCAKVVKGGRRFTFASMVVIGDSKGVVGWGYGKAREVPGAIDKATRTAQKRLFRVPLDGGTIPHQAKGQFGAARVTLVPAKPGTGVIAGAAVRAVAECAGIRDLLTKSYGSNNAKNLVKATFAGLMSLRSPEYVAKLRGKPIGRKSKPSPVEKPKKDERGR